MPSMLTKRINHNGYNKRDIPGNCAGYNHSNIGGTMIKIILVCMLIPVIFYLSISLVILVSPLIIGGLIWITYKYNRRESIC